jgi:hypothetical protein
MKKLIFGTLFILAFFTIVFGIPQIHIDGGGGGGWNGYRGNSGTSSTSYSSPTYSSFLSILSGNFASTIDIDIPLANELGMALLGPHGETVVVYESVEIEHGTVRYMDTCHKWWGCFSQGTGYNSVDLLITEESVCKFGPGPYRTIVSVIPDISRPQDSFLTMYTLFECKGFNDIVSTLQLPDSWTEEDGFEIYCSSSQDVTIENFNLFSDSHLDYTCVIKNKKLEETIYVGYPQSNVEFYSESAADFLSVDENSEYLFPFTPPQGEEVSFESNEGDIYVFSRTDSNGVSRGKYYLTYDTNNLGSYFILTDKEYSRTKSFLELIPLQEKILDPSSDVIMINQFNNGQQIIGYEMPEIVFQDSPNLDLNTLTSLGSLGFKPVFEIYFNGFEDVSSKCKEVFPELNPRIANETTKYFDPVNENIVCYNNDVIIGSRSGTDISFTLAKNIVFDSFDFDETFQEGQISDIEAFIVNGFSQFNDFTSSEQTPNPGNNGDSDVPGDDPGDDPGRNPDRCDIDPTGCDNNVEER